MVDKPQTAFSTDGPICPYCKTAITPDEGFYYNEEGYELDCDECKEKFRVDPACSWLFRCRPLT